MECKKQPHPAAWLKGYNEKTKIWKERLLNFKWEGNNRNNLEIGRAHILDFRSGKKAAKAMQPLWIG